MFNRHDNSAPALTQMRITQGLPYELRVFAHLNFTQFCMLLGIKDHGIQKLVHCGLEKPQSHMLPTDRYGVTTRSPRHAAVSPPSPDSRHVRLPVGAG